MYIVNMTRTRVIGQINATDLKGDGFGEVSDIVDALALGSFRTNYNMYGHENELLEKIWCCRERDISLTYLQLDMIKKLMTLVKTIIPNTVKEFEKRLLELEKL